MSLPPDHETRMARALVALDGLSTGDAFGERFFIHPGRLEALLAARVLAAAPWQYTDDTEMALAIVEVLDRHGRIEQDDLARVFARRYAAAPDRGYGGTAHTILRGICLGERWQDVAPAAFGGMGSMGNGGAMRVAPIGAYFADDLERVVREARLSAEVTHAHPDGQAGAIAVAVAAAMAARMGAGMEPRSGQALLEAAWASTPDSETRAGLGKALSIPFDDTVVTAASVLGTGRQVLSSDTVPFALWCAARHLDHYEGAMWTTVSGLGDRDTTCAIAGGVVALATGREGIPAEWLAARETLALHPERRQGGPHELGGTPDRPIDQAKPTSPCENRVKGGEQFMCLLNCRKASVMIVACGSSSSMMNLRSSKSSPWLSRRRVTRLSRRVTG